MTTVIAPVRESSVQDEAGPHDESGPDLSLLTDKMPPWLMVPRSWAAYAVVLAVCGWFFSNLRLWHTDLWGHLSYGRWFAMHSGLPTSEPLLPLAQGMPFVNLAWLSQLIGYGTWQVAGPAGLQALHGLTVLIAIAAWCWRTSRQVPFGWVVAGLATWLVLAGVELQVIRPQTAGVACWVLVWALATARPVRASDWFVVPALFALWTNLHGTALIGVACLALMAIGRVLDTGIISGKAGVSPLAAIVRDRQAWRWLLLAQLGFFACLINPQGWNWLSSLSQLADNRNVQDLTEWQPLVLRSALGQAVAAVFLLLLTVARFSSRPFRASEWLPLVVLGLATLWSQRLVVWWAPLVATSLAVHARSAWLRASGAAALWEASPRASKWTVVVAGLAWIAFGLSPLGAIVLRREVRPLEKAVSTQTPLKAVEYLAANPPRGLLLATYEWSDFAQWSLPDVPLFLNSHVHLLPREVWQHYLQITELQANWDETLDRYGVNALLLNPEFHSSLIKRLKDDSRWKIGFEDRLSMVFVRRKPL